MNSLFIFLVVMFSGLFFDRENIFLYCIVFSFLHEAGHIVAYLICYKKWPEINISIFGFRMKNNILIQQNRTLIFFSGPLVNLIFAICAFHLLEIKATFQLYIIFFVNLILFSINILPVYYLDGGQILYGISPFYQRNYIEISNFTIVVIAVMLVYFTDVWAPIRLSCSYFVYNLSNDI